jgi:hypothetical protein
MADVSNQAEQLGRQAHGSEWLDRAVQIGMVAYGIVFLTIAWLAIQLSLGNHSGSASRNGALRQLAQQPFGKFVVWVVAIGMFFLVLWKLLEAYVDFQNEDGAKQWIKAGTNVGKAIVYGTLGYSGVKIASGSGGGGGGTDSFTAKLMDAPAGRFLVGAVGLAVIGYGVYQIWYGWKEKFLKHLSAEGKSGETGKAYTIFGKVGYISKGIALGVIGILFVVAAITHKAKKSGGLDVALHKVLQQPLGPVLLFLIGVGLGCYGLFCFARARHLSAQR